MFTFDMFGFHDPWDGPDRSYWNEKSEAAMRRETQAIGMFNSHLQRLKPFEKSAFPVTADLIPCTLHLTGPCWQTFKAYVMKAGCSAKRREATPEERAKIKKTSKVYVISVTVPTHPDDLQEAARSKKEADAAAAEEKKRKQKLKEEKERLLQIKTAEEYTTILDLLKENTTASTTSLLTDQTNMVEAGSKKRKADSSLETTSVTVPRARLLKYADDMHTKQKYMIDQDLAKERRKLIAEVDRRMAERKKSLIEEAEEKLKLIKDTIETKKKQKL